MSSDDCDSEAKASLWPQKPMPLQRILYENGTNLSRGKSSERSPPSPVQMPTEKENMSGNFTKLQDQPRPRVAFTPSLKELSEASSSDWTASEAMSSTLAFPANSLPPEAMSSTLAFTSIPATPERLSKPALFSASNLSSISLIANASNSPMNSSSLPHTSPQDKEFRTPRRRDGITSSPSNYRLLKTPSTGSSRTPSSRGSRSSSSTSGIRWNPFETQNSSELLHLPTLSPSVFATVTSPSTESTVNGRFWSIEQQAELYPASISEESPMKQSILVRHHSQESESQAQEKIELYFQNHHDITSPPDLPPTGPLLLLKDLSSTSGGDPVHDQSYLLPDNAGAGRSHKQCQTCLSLPPTLPPHVEQVLRQFMLFNNDQNVEEQNNLSNSTLRRKLFNGDAGSDPEISPASSHNSSFSEEEKHVSPFQSITPGKVVHTPVTSRQQNTAQWSSSPVRSRVRTSISPPDINSPMFSPIAKGKTMSRRRMSQMEEETEEEEEQEQEQEHEQEQQEQEISHDVTSNMSQPFKDKRDSLSGPEKDNSELYHTAENSIMQMDIDSNSGLAWGLSLPAQADMETSSRADTGYNTHSSRADTGYNTHSTHGQTTQDCTAPPFYTDRTGPPASPNQNCTGTSAYPGQNCTGTSAYQGQNGTGLSVYPGQNCTGPVPVSGEAGDSGVSTSHQANSLASSVVLPPPLQLPLKRGITSMDSYTTDSTNDISVGFPLGSSTPTKKWKTN